MKVPIYKRQTGPVKSGGQAMLTATADPGMIGSAAGANAQLFGQFAQLGTSVLNNELSLYRETQLQEQMSKLREEEQKVKTDVVNKKYPSKKIQFNRIDRVNQQTVPTEIESYQQPSVATKSHIDNLRGQINSQASRMSDPVARRRFKAAAEKRLIVLEPQIRKTFRARYADYTGAQIEGNLQAMEREYIEASPRNRMLILQDAEAALRRGVSLGVISEKNFLKRINEFGSTAAEGVLRNEIYEAQTANDTNALEKLQQEVNDPKGRFALIDTISKARIGTQLFQYITASDNRSYNRQRQMEKDAIANKKRDQTKQFTELEIRLQKEQENRRNNLPVKNPLTISDILELAGNEKIDANQSRALQNNINNPKEINTKLRAELDEEIRNAVTKSELEQVKSKVENAGESQQIVFDTKQKLLNRIDKQLNDVPEEITAKRYESSIKTLLTDSTNIAPRFGTNIPLGIDTAQQQFRSFIEDQGMRPVEAYNKVMLDFFSSKGQFVSGLIAALPPEVRSSFKDGNTNNTKLIEAVTIQDVQKAKLNWITSLSDKKLPREADVNDLRKYDTQTNATKTSRLSIRNLYRTEVALDNIEEFIKQRDKAILADKQKKANEPKDESSTLSKIGDWWESISFGNKNPDDPTLNK